MNTKKALKRLRCLVVARGLDAKLAARRIDELAARVAESERTVDDLALRLDFQRRLLEIQRRRADDALARVAELEREVAEMRKAAPVSEGTWWCDDGETAAYTVTVEDR